MLTRQMDDNEQTINMRHVHVSLDCIFIYHSRMLFCDHITYGNKEAKAEDEFERNSQVRILWIYWFKKLLSYQVAMVYLLTRLVLNVSQAYLAFFYQ